MIKPPSAFHMRYLCLQILVVQLFLLPSIVVGRKLPSSSGDSRGGNSSSNSINLLGSKYRRNLKDRSDFATISLPELDSTNDVYEKHNTAQEQSENGLEIVNHHDISTDKVAETPSSAIENTAQLQSGTVTGSDSHINQIEKSNIISNGTSDTIFLASQELRNIPGRPHTPLLVNIFDSAHRANVVGFYNVYAAGPYFRGIVDAQVARIEKNGLLPRMDAIYYATMGPGGDRYKINTDKFIHVSHYGDHGEEVQTLGLLYDYCSVNPQAKVLYFHDKGSFHENYMNAKFCSLLSCYVLTPHCIDALDDHDTCGWRATPDPFIHYSGNFWWARCQYINTLIDPLSPMYNTTFQRQTKQLSECVGAHGRYFAESWIGSAPEILPADCMDKSVDRSYLWGYSFPPAADQYCPPVSSMKQPVSGYPCATAAAFRHPLNYKDALLYMRSLSPPDCRQNREMVIKRTEMWYNQMPTTYLEWMDRILGSGQLVDGSAVRFSDSIEIFYVEKEKLRSIPNMVVFNRLKLQQSAIKVIAADERHKYNFGPSM